MGGVCEPPRQEPLVENGACPRAVVYLVLLVGYLVWLHAVDDLGPVMAMGGRVAIQLAYYTLWVWAVFYALNALLAVLLQRMHDA